MEEKKNSKILLVEDEQSLIEAIREKLETNGFEVLSAKTVEQGLNYLKENDDIRAVWLDHYLIGEKTGLDFISNLRADEKYKDLSVFVVTNTGGDDKRESYLHMGAESYYIKSNHKLSEIISDIKERL